MPDVLDRICDVLSQILKYIAAALLLLVGVLITADVVARGLFNYPLIGVAEVIANGVVVIAFLQLSYTVRIGGMLRSELIETIAPASVARAMNVIGLLLGALLFGLIAWASWEPMIRAFTSGEFEGHASFQVPTWPLRSIIVFCSAFAAVNYLLMATRAGLDGFHRDAKGV